MRGFLLTTALLSLNTFILLSFLKHTIQDSVQFLYHRFPGLPLGEGLPQDVANFNRKWNKSPCHVGVKVLHDCPAWGAARGESFARPFPSMIVSFSEWLTPHQSCINDGVMNLWDIKDGAREKPSKQKQQLR